jgi:hypothetical protein
MRQAGDRPGEVTALTDLGIMAYNRGDITPALAHFEQALTLACCSIWASRRPWSMWSTCNAIGWANRLPACLDPVKQDRAARPTGAPVWRS